MSLERIIITFNADGTFRGSSSTDFGGQPVDISLVDLQSLGIDTASLVRITELEAAVESIPAKDEQIATLTEQLSAANARVEELTAPPVGIQPIRAWQAKAVLSLAGLLDAAIAVIDALEEPQRTVVRSAWDNNADFARDSQTVLSLAAALSLTDEQLDAMFSQAANLTV